MRLLRSQPWTPFLAGRVRPTWPVLLLLALCGWWGTRLLWAPSGNDLLVYGGTPQGVMAAVAASRQGQRVVLVTPGGRPGGVLTQGWLATLDLSADSRGHPLSRGMFLNLYRKLGHDNSFDVGELASLLNALLGGSSVRVLRDAALLSAGREAGRQNRLGCPVFAQGGRRRAVCASVYLDASDDAGLAARAGAPFTLGRADTGRDRLQMAAGLVFRLRGVRWPALRAVLRQQGNGLSHLHSISGRTLVGLDTLAAGYLSSDPRRFFLRGFNGARQDDDSLLLNALLLLGVDGTDPASVRAARRAGDLEAQRVTRYLRRTLPSVFGSVSYGGAAPQLYLRETRHLVGEVRLHADDVFYGRHFADGVAVGAYPMDGQMYSPGEAPYLIGHPAPYEVPLRSLIPLGLTNLLVVSQAASFDSVAAFSARVAPLQMNLGEAAGLAAALSTQTHTPVSGLAHNPLLVGLLRARITLRGGLVRAPRGAERLPCRDQLNSASLTASRLLRRGLMSAPYYYHGCLYLDQPESAVNFVNDVQHGLDGSMFRARLPEFRWLDRAYLDHLPYNQPLSTDDARLILRVLNLSVPPPSQTLLTRTGTLSRAEAAELRWALQADAQHAGVNPLPPPGAKVTVKGSPPE